jgi:hypothetical protein
MRKDYQNDGEVIQQMFEVLEQALLDFACYRAMVLEADTEQGGDARSDLIYTLAAKRSAQAALGYPDRLGRLNPNDRFDRLAVIQSVFLSHIDNEYDIAAVTRFVETGDDDEADTDK